MSSMRYISYLPTFFGGVVDVIRSVEKTDCWPHYFPDGWNRARIVDELSPIKDYRDDIFCLAIDDFLTVTLSDKTITSPISISSEFT